MSANPVPRTAISGRNLNLAVWILFCNINGPRPATIAAVQNSSQASDRREDKPVIKNPDEDQVLKIQPLRFILLIISDGT